MLNANAKTIWVQGVDATDVQNNKNDDSILNLN